MIRKLHNKYRLIIAAAIMGLITLSGVSVSAGASGTASSKDASGNWIYYPVNEALTNQATLHVQGTIGRDGSCIFESSGARNAQDGALSKIETGLNTATCQAIFITGTPTTSSGTVPVGGSSVTTSKSFALGSASGPDIISFQTSAYQNLSWIDPVGMQVTHEDQSLTWTSNGSEDTGWSQNVDFWYRGITGWAPRWEYDNSTGTQPANVLSNSSYINQLFCAPWTVYTYFGWDGSQRVNDYLYGYSDGSYTYGATLVANGNSACTVMLHSAQTVG